MELEDHARAPCARLHTSNAPVAGIARYQRAMKTITNTKTKEIVSSIPTDSVSLALPGREVEESEVRKLHSEWLGLRRTSTNTAMKIGGILTVLKADLKKVTPQRNWEPYVRDHLGIEPRTASNYLRIYRETSNTNGNLLKSETVSELGVREALDFLADLKKAGETVSGASGAENDSRKNEPARSKKTAGPPPLQLADGSRINMTRLQWADGLISRRALESWMTRINPGGDEPGARKIEARRQRAVVQIAVGINRACGRAKPEAASELIESSFEVIRTLLSDSNEQ